MSISLAEPRRWFEAHADEVHAALAAVISDGRYMLGPQVARFEQAFAEAQGAAHAVAVASGTDALALTLRALEVAGGEVVTSAHTATATLAAIELAGAQPVLADIEPDSRCLAPTSVASLMGPHTRAIIPVHLYGHPADMAPLLALAAGRGLPVVEDCAQAQGAFLDGRAVGTFGRAGAFSFYPTKNLGALGDAGAVVTDDAALAARLRELRQYGWNEQRQAQQAGTNSRMDELQAAILNLRLTGFPRAMERRRAIAARYSEALAGQPRIRAPRQGPGAQHAWHLYVVECDDRDGLAAHLARAGIGTGIHYPTPAHCQPAYRALRRDGSLPVLAQLTPKILTLPCYPELSDAEVDRVIEALLAFRPTAETHDDES